MLPIFHELSGKVSELDQRYADFTKYCTEWMPQLSLFENTVKRAPVLYELQCATGTYSLGAAALGVQCHGFDTSDTYAKNYEAISNATFHRVPASLTTWLATIMVEGKLGDAPAPDCIHVNLPAGVSAVKTVDWLHHICQECHRQGRPAPFLHLPGR